VSIARAAILSHLVSPPRLSLPQAPLLLPPAPSRTPLTLSISLDPPYSTPFFSLRRSLFISRAHPGSRTLPLVAQVKSALHERGFPLDTFAPHLKDQVEALDTDHDGFLSANEIEDMIFLYKTIKVRDGAHA